MPRKVFDAFTRLDASDINTFLMDQSVMVFGGTAARGSAIPTPIDGMAAYLQDSDTLTIYNGSDWSPVGGGEPGLQLIASSSFSAVSSEQLNDVFSADYENYKIIINITSGSVSGADLSLRMASAGTADSTGSRYEVGEYFVGARSAVTAGSVNSAAAAQGQLGRIATDAGCGVEVNMYNPFTANLTKFAALSVGHTLEVTGTALIVTDSYDGFQIFPSSGTITGTITVYGIRES
jgi:hypothetical protein